MLLTRAYASRSNRLFGQLLDGIIGAAPIFVAFLVTMVIPPLGTILMIGAIGWSFFYYLFADGFRDGQSFGKRWVGMHVISEETGQPCTFWQSFIRNLLLAILGPIDWIFIFGDKHQRLGDKAAGTIVVLD